MRLSRVDHEKSLRHDPKLVNQGLIVFSDFYWTQLYRAALFGAQLECIKKWLMQPRAECVGEKKQLID